MAATCISLTCVHIGSVFEILPVGMQMVVMFLVVLFYDWEGLADSAVGILAGPSAQVSTLAPRRRNSLSTPLLDECLTDSAGSGPETALEEGRRLPSREEARQTAVISLSFSV